MASLTLRGEAVTPIPAAVSPSGIISDQLMGKYVFFSAHIMDCLTDNKLREIAFSVFLKLVALPSASASIHDPEVDKRLKYAIQLLWELHKKSGHSLKQRFAEYVSKEPHLVTFTLKRMCSCLESYDTLKRGPQLLVYTHLVHIICNSILLHPKAMANVQEYDQLLKDVLQILKCTDSSYVLLDVSYEQGIAALVLMLYLCAGNPPICQLIKQSHCLQSVGALIQLSSSRIKVLSKALIARLISADAVRDDMAVLILIEDDEVDHLMSIVGRVSSYETIPVISVLMDLCRSPHNMGALVSRDAALKLSDVMESISADDQTKVAQLVWKMMELNYQGTEEVSSIINSGTLLLQDEGCQVDAEDCEDKTQQRLCIKVDNGFVSYIVDCIEAFENGFINTDSMIKNLSAAIVLQYKAMEMSDDDFRRESARSINSSSTYSALNKLLSYLCIIFFKEATEEIANDVHLVVLSSLVWWTCHSEATSAGLSRSGIISGLVNLLPIYIQLNMYDKIDLCLKIFINCTSDSSNLPAFNSSLSVSDTILHILPLTHGLQSSLALHSKLLLAFLNPILDCEQLCALKLTRKEASMCVSLLSAAVQHPHHLVEDYTLLTFLRALIWFTHEYNRQDKTQKKKKCSDFEDKLTSVSQELKCNIQLLVEEGMLSAFKSVLSLNGEDELQATAARLLWSLSHETTVQTQIQLNHPDIVEVLQDIHTHSSLPNLNMASHCALWILGLGIQNLLKYSKCCLEFKNYLECIEVCDVIIQMKQDESIMMQAMITKGKARFYSYKRKLNQILVNNNIRATEEGRFILKECFTSMKETISLLGNGLDQNVLDEEGSKLLDWAMIDCLSMTNQLNLCYRCFLCRQKKTKLIKSHVWPRFIVNLLVEEQSPDQEFIFGLDKHKFKSAKDCTYWMLCERCEAILSQNGENDFKPKFPTCGEITYSSWLFSFCAGVIFRTLSIAVQFPMHFNDDEIYKVLLLCRKHLLSLPVTIKGKVSSLSICEARQLEELTQQLREDLDIYLFISPLQSCQDYGSFQYAYPNAAIAISRFKQLDSSILNFNGYAHFYFLCCGPITLIVNLDQPLLSLKNKGFHMTSNPIVSDHKYTIPSEDECAKLLPAGVWPLMAQLTEGTMKDFTEVSRFISPKAKAPATYSSKNVPTMNIPLQTHFKSAMFQVSYLCSGYEILNPHVKLPRNHCVKLPKGHQVIIHASKTVAVANTILTFLLCIGKVEKTSTCESLYVIYVSLNTEHCTLYADSAFAEVNNGQIILRKYMLENDVADRLRYDLTCMQRHFNITLPNKHFENVDMLMSLVKSRRCIKGPLTCILPSLDRKCSLEGCWYCSDLCQHCMQSSYTLYSGVCENGSQLKFCSEECMGFWFPSQDQKSLYVASYLDETYQSQQAVMTFISRKENGVEQVYLSVDKASDGLDKPYILWHVRELEHQHFAHFYITKDCLPLNSVWTKQYRSYESEIVSNLITTKRLELQSHFQAQFNEAVKEYGFENFEAFLSQVKISKGESLELEMLTMVPEVTKKETIRLNLPPGYIFCKPELGLAHGSIKNPLLDVTGLLHYTEVDESFQTVYLLDAIDMFNANSPLQLHFLFIKHHLEEGWYFADGAILSSDASQATKFLLDKPFYERSLQAMEEINRMVQDIVPKMLRKNGVSSIWPSIRLAKYTWINSIAVKSDLPCSASNNCWFCKQFCSCCCKYLLSPKNGSEFCCTECHDIMLNPLTIPKVILNEAKLANILKFNDPPLIAFMNKVVSTNSDSKMILRIYLSRSDDSFDVIPPGTLFAICQIKTAKTQAVIDCLLSKDYVPVEPVWYSDFCEQMIDKHRELLHREIAYLVTEAPVTEER